MSLKKNLFYYLGTSTRRKLLDKLLEENKKYFKGIVLDIGGGRKRGRFVAPKTQKWIFADITPELKPDVVCNVEKMQFDDESFDAIKATELFEHVACPEEGIRECYRVLKKGSYFIISMPFLSPVHGDPYDFQRWTETKWRKILMETGFKVEKIVMMGGFFTVIYDMVKNLTRKLPRIARFFCYGFYPLLDLAKLIDNIVAPFSDTYTTGYFIIAKK